MLIAGIEIHRYKASHDLVALAEKMGAPVFTTVLGKGAFPMDHPLYMGVHVGPISPPPIVARMDAADFVLNLGCLKTDMNFGNRPPHVIQGRSVWAVDRQVDVKYHTYTDVGVRDFVRALLRQNLRHHHEKVVYADNLREIAGARRQAGPGRADSVARSTNFWPTIATTWSSPSRATCCSAASTFACRTTAPIWRRAFTPRWVSRYRPRSARRSGAACGRWCCAATAAFR